MGGNESTSAAGGTESTGYAEGEGQRIRSLDDLFGRLDAQEGKLDRLAELVSRVIPGSHAEAEQRTGARLDRPTRAADSAADVGAQVRAELDRRDKEAAGRAEQDELKAAVARLQETPPRAPVRRATKLLGWADRG